MRRGELSEDELDRMIGDATVDAYDNEEVFVTTLPDESGRVVTASGANMKLSQADVQLLHKLHSALLFYAS